MEQYRTLATGTVNGAINNSQTTVSVANSPWLFPSVGNFKILIDSEVMKVTAVSAGTSPATFTIVRAQEGTAAASHLNAAPVRMITTSDVFFQFRQDTAGYDTIANLNAVNAAQQRAGRLGLASDVYYTGHDQGVSGLANNGYLYEMEPPDYASFTWRNQLTALAGSAAGYLHFIAPSNGTGTHIAFLEKTVPASNWTCDAYIIGNRHHVDYLMYGMGMLETSSGKLATMHSVSSAGHKWEYNWWNSVSSFNQVRVQMVFGHFGLHYTWFRMQRVGTELRSYLSHNGYDWRFYAVDNLNSWFSTAPDRVGLMLQLGQPGTGYYQELSCLHWKIY